jgi:small conductance mechanosensitive channel
MPEELAEVGKYMDIIIEFAIKYGFQVVYAIIILIIGLIVARWLANMIAPLAGLMSNYGAGLSIIIARPFVVGDTINIQGVSGVVEEIGLASTRLSTEDGEQITIPNKHIVGEILINSFENKVIEMSIGISYDDDARKAVEIIQETLGTIPEIVDEPAPQIGIEEFADSSVNIGMRYWVPTKQYFQILYQANLAVYEALNKAEITIPFPQRDIHMLSET